MAARLLRLRLRLGRLGGGSAGSSARRSCERLIKGDDCGDGGDGSGRSDDGEQHKD